MSSESRSLDVRGARTTATRTATTATRSAAAPATSAATTTAGPAAPAAASSTPRTARTSTAATWPGAIDPTRAWSSIPGWLVTAFRRAALPAPSYRTAAASAKADRFTDA